MNKYILRDEIDLKKYNITKMANRTGISRQTIYNIINKKQPTSKPFAYMITKFISSEKEINDFFKLI